MAYKTPGITVTQEFQNTTPALAAFTLPNVSVGPIFQVVKLAVAGSYSGVAHTYDWAGKIAGTLPVTAAANSADLVDFPVVVQLKNALVAIASDEATSTVMSNLTVLGGITAEVVSLLQVGDLVKIAAGSAAGTYSIREKIDATTIRLNETLPAAVEGQAIDFLRSLGTALHTVAPSAVDAEEGISLPAGLEIAGKEVVSATVVVSYRALRLENSSDVKEYATVAELQADFGIDQIVPENPAVFSAYLALSNAVTKTSILGLKGDYLTDEVLAYTKAFDLLKMVDVYAITALTQNTSVHTVLKAHVEGLSAPTKKLERVGIVNRKLVTTMIVSGEHLDAITSEAGLVLTVSGAQFITDGVVPGHFVASATQRLKIAEVISQTQVRLHAAATAATAESFVVERDLSKSEQASVMAAYARSLGSRRLILTFPDVIKLASNNLIREVPGYFLNAAIGALTTGLPTQQGLTNLGTALYTGVVHSSKYFDSEQLDLIADGGVMIFVQDVLDQTPLYIRHQLTTDRSSIKFQEYSVTKNVDFIAKFIRNNHMQFIGQYNIVDSTLDDLKTNAKGIINFLTESTRQPRIGGVIKGGSLTSIGADPSNIDTVVARYQFDIPIPLNNLDITVVV